MKAAILALSITGALANWMPSTLSARDLVKIPCNELGEKPCGDGCVPLTYTCCPDQAGGCPATARCDIADNGKYGCCPLGTTCEGPGGASTDFNTRTGIIPGDTSTVTIPQKPTSTTEPTSTEEPTSTTEPTSTEELPSSSATSYSASTPFTTVSSAPVPSRVPNATATTPPPPVITAGATTNGLSASGLIGVLAGALALLF